MAVGFFTQGIEYTLPHPQIPQRTVLLLRSVYTSGDWDTYWEAHMQRERTLMNQRMFDGIGYPDDYDTDVEDLYLDELTGT
jgi:hypothetical protein